MDEIPKTIPIRDREDPFIIEEVIGEGGMGKVYRAHDPVTGARLAVKVLSDVGDPTRFALESDILSKLEHPNIVAYRGHGLTKDGHPYLAMEWIDGDDLEKHLETGTLSVEEVIRVARSVTDALSAAHAAGVIHRDLKPSNVILTRERRVVKLVDFGISRASHVEGLTKTGQALGTPGYMSPEQARGQSVDARSDLFSLGCLIYRCVGGRRPFAGSDIMQFATSLALEDPPRLREIAPLVPADLEALVARLLQKDPALRPETALHVRQALDRIAAGADRTSLAPTAEAPAAGAPVPKEATAVLSVVADTRRSPGGPTGRSPAQLAVVAALGVIALVGVVLVARRPSESRSKPPAPVASVPSVPSVPSGSVAPPPVAPPPSTIDRAALDRACKRWAAAIAKDQRADGCFAGEERAAPSGWDTAQQLFALAEAHRACDGTTVATLAAGVRALDAMHLDHGWLGPRSGVVPASDKHGETPANAWALLALATIARDTKDANAVKGAARARTDLLGGRNADGGFRERPNAPAPSALYATALAAWALSPVGAVTPVSPVPSPEASGALAWLASAVDHGAPGTRELGFSEELAWIARASDGPTKKTLATETLLHCRADLHGVCSRTTYDTGRVPTQADGGGALVAPWHPWATLAAATLAKDPQIDPDARTTLDAMSRWGTSELTASIDLLGAAPAYKLSEYLIVVSELLDAK